MVLFFSQPTNMPLAHIYDPITITHVSSMYATPHLVDFLFTGRFWRPVGQGHPGVLGCKAGKFPHWSDSWAPGLPSMPRSWTILILFLELWWKIFVLNKSAFYQVILLVFLINIFLRKIGDFSSLLFVDLRLTAVICSSHPKLSLCFYFWKIFSQLSLFKKIGLLGLFRRNFGGHKVCSWDTHMWFVRQFFLVFVVRNNVFFCSPTEKSFFSHLKVFCGFIFR